MRTVSPKLSRLTKQPVGSYTRSKDNARTLGRGHCRLRVIPTPPDLRECRYRTVRTKYIGQRNGTLSDDLEIRDAQVKRRAPVLLALQEIVLIAKSRTTCANITEEKYQLRTSHQSAEAYGSHDDRRQTTRGENGSLEWHPNWLRSSASSAAVRPDKCAAHRI